MWNMTTLRQEVKSRKAGPVAYARRMKQTARHMQRPNSTKYTQQRWRRPIWRRSGLPPKEHEGLEMWMQQGMCPAANGQGLLLLIGKRLLLQQPVLYP
eukprot:1695004-Prymnesium_polylepis.1